MNHVPPIMILLACACWVLAAFSNVSEEASSLLGIGGLLCMVMAAMFEIAPRMWRE